jgi:hypothetical protein
MAYEAMFATSGQGFLGLSTMRGYLFRKVSIRKAVEVWIM